MLDKHGPTANTFNNHLRAVKSIFAYAKKYHGLTPNPALGLEKISITTDGFPEWEIEDIERFVATHPLGTKAYLAFMLLMHVAPRRSDLVKLGPSNIIERGGVKMVSFKPQKTARSSNIQVILPLHPELEEAIQNTTTGPETFLITEFGTAVHIEWVRQQDGRMARRRRDQEGCRVPRDAEDRRHQSRRA